MGFYVLYNLSLGARITPGSSSSKNITLLCSANNSPFMLL